MTKRRSPKTRVAYTPERVLSNWRNLRQAIPRMKEDELKTALDKELEGDKRKDFIYRLHRRLASVRKKREKQELQEQLT